MKALGSGPVLPLLLATVSLVSCTLAAGVYPTELDSVQLLFGLDNFDVTQESPHPPGYWLYVASARAVRALTPLSGTRSLELLAALATAATVGLTTQLGRRLGRAWLGLAAGAFVLTSPFTLFYGSMPSTYPFDALLAVILVFLSLDARPRSWHTFAAAALLGLGSGFRQTSLIVLGPLAFWAAVKSVRSWKAALGTVAAGAAGVLVWFVPMLVEQPGGWDRYRTYSKGYLHVLSGTSLFHGAPRHLVVRNVLEGLGYSFIAVALLLPLFAVGLLWTVVRRRSRAPLPREAVILLVLAVAGPGLFALLVHFGKAGYVNGYLPGLVLLLLLPCAFLPKRAMAVVSVVVVGACLFNLERWTLKDYILPPTSGNTAGLWFTQPQYGWPYPITLREIRKTDRETRQYGELRQRFDPAKDVLVYAGPNGGYRFRHGNLVLPEFTIHFVAPPIDAHTVLRRHVEHDYDSVIEVPPGGRAVWVLDVDPPEMAEQAAAGLLVAEEVAGRRVWVTQPGARLYGVTVEVRPDALQPRNQPRPP